MISKEKWAEIKLDWKRYGHEYISLGFVILMVLLAIWVFFIAPSIKSFHKNELISLKTELLQKIEDNSAILDFSNENDTKKAKSNLEEISKNDKIGFESVKIHKNGEKFEVQVQFKSAK